MLHSRPLVLALVVAAACAGARPAPPAATPPRVASSEWTAFVEQYLETYLSAHPSLAVALGRHEFDGQLPDWSRAGFQQQVGLLERTRMQALAFPSRSLSSEQLFQRDYLLNQLDGELFWLRDVRAPFTNPAFYFDRGLDPHTYVSTPYAPLERRLVAFIAYATAIPNALSQIRSNLETPLPKPFVDYAVAGFRGFADFYRKDAPRAFEAVKDEQLQVRLKAALEPAAQAMAELGEWFAAQSVYAEHAYVLGPERFSAMLLKTEGVATSLPELEKIGRADLERNLRSLASACKHYLPDATLVDCVAKEAADKPQGGPVEGASRQLSDLKRYLIEHEIVSVVGTEQVRVAEAPPYMRQNFAYIDIPGPYEKNLPSVYYIAPPDPSWSQAEQEAYMPGKADLLFTSVHEVWPGHFLQFLHSNRSSWRFGQVFVGYAFAEGWAHYVEELMVEEGIARDSPELQIGQLLNALLRNVRYLCAIGLHTQGLTVAECEQMFKDQAYQDAGNARQQAARGTYDPGYLNYTLGKLMIRKLRASWETENPGHSRQEFHDQFLSFGGPPIPLLRAKLLKHPGDALF